MSKRNGKVVIISFIMVLCLIFCSLTVLAETPNTSVSPKISNELDSGSNAETTGQQTAISDISDDEGNLSVPLDEPEEQFESVESEDNKTSNVDFPYNYPPPEEWNYIVGVDKYIPLNIPEEYLKLMDTASLVQAVLDYPVITQIYSFNTVQKGFETVTSWFNGLQELLQRPDAGEFLLRTYQNSCVITEDLLGRVDTNAKPRQ